MEQLPIIGPFADIGGWIAVVSLIVISMIKGWLVPSSQLDRIERYHDFIVRDKDRQIDSWKEAYQASDARGDLLAKNLQELLQATNTTNSVIESIKQRLPERSDK